MESNLLWLIHKIKGLTFWQKHLIPQAYGFSRDDNEYQNNNFIRVHEQPYNKKKNLSLEKKTLLRLLSRIQKNHKRKKKESRIKMKTRTKAFKTNA